jgi:hypothetical protein
LLEQRVALISARFCLNALTHSAIVAGGRTAGRAVHVSDGEEVAQLSVSQLTSRLPGTPGLPR